MPTEENRYTPSCVVCAIPAPTGFREKSRAWQGNVRSPKAVYVLRADVPSKPVKSLMSVHDVAHVPIENNGVYIVVDIKK